VILHAEAQRSNDPFPPGVQAQLDSLRPHLARASLMSARLAFDQARASVDTLSRLGLAAASVTQNGVLRVTNAFGIPCSARGTSASRIRCVLLVLSHEQVFSQEVVVSCSFVILVFPLAVG
jgi:hypothetical protein